MEATAKRYEVARMNELESVACPCGWSRRAFAVPGNPASVHLVDIQKDAKTHYHKKITEIYVVLEGEGHLELDGELVPIQPMTAVTIRPGCRHRAIGEFKILNIAIPAFDAADEWMD